MYKVFIAILFLSCLTSCEEKKEDLRAKVIPGLLPISKAKKIIGSYTGRHDTTFYLHNWKMNLDADTIEENVNVSEMLSDPYPLVSVYFIKKDTLIFIPVEAVSGTIPEVKAVSLEDGKPDKLGVWFTRKEKDGSYTYNISIYTFYELEPYCLFSFQLYKILPDESIVNPRVFEIEKSKDAATVINIYEAEVKKSNTEEYVNKGPLLVKKGEPVEIYMYRDYPTKEGAIWGTQLFPSGPGTIGYKCAIIPKGENY